MIGLRGYLKLLVPLLFAAAVPLVAQTFNTYGCPGGNDSAQIGGFTAGTPTDSEICLVPVGAQFNTSGVYDVTITRQDTDAQITVIGTAQSNLLTLTVPASFYASIGGTTPVSVSLSAFAPQFGDTHTGTFQINPPLANGGPIFVNQLGTAVSWTLFSGGTAPFTDEYNSGNLPNNNLPPTSNIWNFTPATANIFNFSTTATDAWGNSLTTTLSAYIIPTPLISSVSPPSGAVGSGAVSLTINGTGFLQPALIQQVQYPGSTVQVGFGSGNPLTLTPTSYSATQLTVTLPANLTNAEGNLSISVNDIGVQTTPSVYTFPVNPYISSISPSIRTAGLPGFTLTVNGGGFSTGAIVLNNGGNLVTTVVNSGLATATVPSLTTPGPYSISLVNVDDTVVAAPAILTVVAAPTVSSLLPASINAGSAGFALTVTGSLFQSGMTIYFNGAPLPTTLVQNQQNNRLTATVPASAVANPGVVTVTVVTGDGFQTPSLPFTINSTGPPPLQLTSLSPLSPGVVNSAYTFTLTATGGAGGYSFSLLNGSLPAGLQLSSAGVVSGTPTAFGASQFTVQVMDSAGATVSRAFTLTIAPLPLTLTTGPLANVTVNTPVNVQFAGTGGYPPYTFVEFGALPAGVKFTSAGLLSGTPTATGTFPLLVFINDTSDASASKNYTLTVALPGVLITQPSPLPPGQVYVNYSTQLTASGGVGAPYTWSATGLPAGLNIANNSGLIDGLPTAIGTFPVTVTVKDHNGSSFTQTYTLVIASPALQVITAVLPNGAVGSSYNAGLNASGGSGTYTFSATGLPAGVTLSPAGIVTGTPTTAGAYTVAVTITDSTGLTATVTFKVTIAAKVVVNPITIPNATQGAAISPVTLTATGGTPPYQWQSATLPPGLTLSSSGTLSGTPTIAGSYSFTVYAVDSNGSLASGTGQLTVALPTAPTASIVGLPASSAPAQQPSLQLTLSAPYPAAITATLTLTFKPVSGADDPSIQFSTGGRTAQLAIPPGATVSPSSVGVQTGTVAGTITITVQLTSNGVNVTPTPAPSQTFTVAPTAPVITGVTATRTNTGFTVMVTGYASNRDVDTGSYQFAASEGSSLQTTQLTTTVTPLFTTWYGSTSSAPYGSQFTLSQPFTVNGSTASVLSVTVMLTNSLGNSSQVMAILQ